MLDRLVAHGLVFREEIGRSQVYTLNWDHLAAKPIAQLANLRPALFQRLRETFEAWDPAPLHVSVFGSVARGDGGLDSDVDLFVVRPKDIDEKDENWRNQVESLSSRVYDWTGNHAGIAEVDEGDLERLRRDRPPILESLQRDAIGLAGVSVQRVLRRM